MPIKSFAQSATGMLHDGQFTVTLTGNETRISREELLSHAHSIRPTSGPNGLFRCSAQARPQEKNIDGKTAYSWDGWFVPAPQILS